MILDGAVSVVGVHRYFGLAWGARSSVEVVLNWDHNRMFGERDSFAVAGKLLSLNAVEGGSWVAGELLNLNAVEEDSWVAVVAASVVKVGRDVRLAIPARCSPFRRSNLG